MEYLTVRETSEKWGMSIRMVNYYLNTGRIEGAVRKKSEWLIPYTAKSPLDIRKKADTKKSTKRKRNVNKCYMPLIASPCPGSFQEFEHSLADEEERQITRALWHYSQRRERVLHSERAMLQQRKCTDTFGGALGACHGNCSGRRSSRGFS